MRPSQQHQIHRNFMDNKILSSVFLSNASFDGRVEFDKLAGRTTALSNDQSSEHPQYLCLN